MICLECGTVIKNKATQVKDGLCASCCGKLGSGTDLEAARKLAGIGVEPAAVAKKNTRTPKRSFLPPRASVATAGQASKAEPCEGANSAPMATAQPEAPGSSQATGTNVDPDLSASRILATVRSTEKPVPAEVDHWFAVLQQLKANIDQSFFRLGGVLYVIHARQLWRDKGFKTLDEFLESDIGFSHRKASYLISIWSTFCERLRVPDERLAGIGWSLLKEIAALGPAVDSENVNAWLDKARAMSVSELKACVRQVRAQLAAVGTAGDEKPAARRATGCASESEARLEAAAAGHLEDPPGPPTPSDSDEWVGLGHVRVSKSQARVIDQAVKRQVQKYSFTANERGQAIYSMAAEALGGCDSARNDLPIVLRTLCDLHKIEITAMRRAGRGTDYEVVWTSLRDNGKGKVVEANYAASKDGTQEQDMAAPKDAPEVEVVTDEAQGAVEDDIPFE